MPPIRTPIKPVKTERTHEENQERAYIAASRRSDRSLEARIESARRASEIHKKRTGRGLRVTEQDVVNEEMYEEEDDDLPTQYQRLSAHLSSQSRFFNQRLHDYIASQAGVRGMFMQQSGLPVYGQQFVSNPLQYPQTINPYMPQNMNPPQMFNQSPQTFSLQVPNQSQQAFRQNPYMAQRPQQHQRSASIATTQELQPTAQGAPTTESIETRRMSLPPCSVEQPSLQSPQDQSQPSLPRSITDGSGAHQSRSPQHKVANATSVSSSAHGTPPSLSGNVTPPTQQFMMNNNVSNPQAVTMNPLSMSLPPESQQFLGHSLEPTDLHTQILMAGSERLPQPFTTYHYNPNLSPKASRAPSHAATANSTTPKSNGTPPSNMTHSFGQDAMKVNTTFDSSAMTDPSSMMSDSLISPFSAYPNSIFDFPNGYDSLQLSDFSATNNNQEDFDESAFLDDSVWDN
ncbi:hypothetical protein P154DRAFT_187364 [Amniculicola lignicola CBS 123094]|uniref:Uncharacterized protein n=1 Tax=Amniculicola lignicola CBS 123094 TaxID=1392246 RepID=A0A6A5WI12_9PLEO|nr:hypothetical protein P154DRAFT_187364 [Amniculicola lignicola CBS 123094]